MTEERLVLADLLEKAGDGDFLRAVAEAVLQLLMESDVEGMIGAGRYERSPAVAIVVVVEVMVPAEIAAQIARLRSPTADGALPSLRWKVE